MKTPLPQKLNIDTQKMTAKEVAFVITLNTLIDFLSKGEEEFSGTVCSKCHYPRGHNPACEYFPTQPVTQREWEVEWNNKPFSVPQPNQDGEFTYLICPDCKSQRFCCKECSKSFISSTIKQSIDQYKEELLGEIEKFIDDNDDGLWSGRETADTIRSLINNNNQK